MKTIYEIITIALTDPHNYEDDGAVNWSFIDSDLWLDADADNYTDQEKYDGLDNYIDDYSNNEHLMMNH